MRPPTLLVIEDSEEQVVLLSAAALRTRPGLTIKTASDGLEGIAYLAGLPPFEDRKANPRPDLIILDLIMPEVDGFEVLAWIKERPEPVGAPVVVLTGSPDERDEERARALGAAEVYRKPEDLDALAAVVREIVERWIGRSSMIGAHIWAAG